MWCGKQEMAAILPLILTGWLVGESSQALTTFGKPIPTSPKVVEPTVPPARACYKQTECAGISSSSCVRTHYDPTTRCLCGDNTPPLNGQCEAPTKTLYHVCTTSDECVDSMVCVPPNITASSPPHLQVFTNLDKICLCDNDTGFKEKDHSCNDADILKTSLFAIVVMTCLRKTLVY